MVENKTISKVTGTISSNPWEWFSPQPWVFPATQVLVSVLLEACEEPLHRAGTLSVQLNLCGALFGAFQLPCSPQTLSSASSSHAARRAPPQSPLPGWQLLGSLLPVVSQDHCPSLPAFSCHENCFMYSAHFLHCFR